MRLVWTREDELCCAPFGSAMRTELRASLGPDGLIARWSATVRSGTHADRPGWHDGIRFVAAGLLAEPLPAGSLRDLPEALGWGALRNARPYYRVADPRIEHELLALPLRTSSVRSLGAHVNVAAIESMMDELAAGNREDPLAFRLRHLDDPRARAVLERVADMACWRARDRQPLALGIGFARYKNSAAYLAVIVALDLGRDVQVRQVWAAVDAGFVVNPDGVRNQVEGGIVQALSWTLHEEVRWDRDGITTSDWSQYRIARFRDVPRVDVDIVDAAGHPPLGVGEVACGPTAAAVANALASALGTRLTRMPFTRDRIIAALA